MSNKQTNQSNNKSNKLQYLYDGRSSLDIFNLLSEYNEGFEELICAQFPQFLKDINIITIPKKVEFVLRRYISKKLLRGVNKDFETSIELCLMFLSNLSNTYFLMKETTSEYYKLGWKRLRTETLNEQFGGQYTIRKKILKVLYSKTSKGSIIECDYKSSKGNYSYCYRLTTTYLAKGVTKAEIKTNLAMYYLKKSNSRKLYNAMQNVIAQNLITLYSLLTLPTEDEILIEANRLIKENYFTKKGKRLAFNNNHTESDYKTPVSFVEDAIEVFKYLTDNGFMIPTIGKAKSGGRVVDSMNLMPSWIRNLIKINGEPLIEVDYSAMHPNIAISIYGGKTHYLTHTQIAVESGIDLKQIKIENLSFFNKEIHVMMQSQLWGYYCEKEPQMMQNIVKDKNEDDYKISSKRMLTKEVEIMTEVIHILNKQGIFVMYIYDALCTTKEHLKIVKSTMNEIALKHNIFTTAK